MQADARRCASGGVISARAQRCPREQQQNSALGGDVECAAEVRQEMFSAPPRQPCRFNADMRVAPPQMRDGVFMIERRLRRADDICLMRQTRTSLRRKPALLPLSDTLRKEDATIH